MRLALALLLLCVPAAHGQAIPPGVTAEQPLASVATGLDVLRDASPERPFVFVHRPGAAPADWKRPAEQLAQVVQAWEVFLLGLGIPYRMIDDADLEDGLPRHARVLVLPGSELLGARHERQVTRFVARGGGLIAQGRIGLMDAGGGAAFFRTLFGAEYVEALPPQPGGIFQTLDGSHAVTAGIEPGYRLNLVAQVPTTAARPVTAQPLGTLLTYDAPDQAAFDGLTMLLSGAHGQGRFVWSRFRPSDVARAPEQQRAYVTLLVAALAYVTDTPVASLRPWPHAHAAAVAPTIVPLVGDLTVFRPSLMRLMDALDAEQAPATFFFTAEKATLFGDVLERAAQTGEVALSSLDDRVLKGRTLEEQTEQLRRGADLLESYAGRVQGLHPPAGFYDENTIRAMEAAGLRYLLRFPPHPSAGLDPLGLTERADYRETRFGARVDPDTLRVIGEVGLSDVGAPGVPSTQAIPPSVTFDDSMGRPVDAADLPGTSPGAADGSAAETAESPPDPLAAYRTRERVRTRRRAGSRTTAALPAGTPPAERPAASPGDASGLTNRPLRPGAIAPPLTGDDAPEGGTPPGGGDAPKGYPARADGLPVLSPETGDIHTPAAVGLARPLASDERLVALPILGRTSYRITSDPAIGEDPLLQFAAYRNDFLDVLDARGLYVMPIEAELQARTDAQAAVVAELVAYARAEGAWVATLGQIRRWWLARDRVGVELGEVSASGVTLTLDNGNPAPVGGLSVDVFAPVPPGRVARLDHPAARLAAAETDRTVLVVPSLPPGRSVYRIAFE